MFVRLIHFTVMKSVECSRFDYVCDCIVSRSCCSCKAFCRVIQAWPNLAPFNWSVKRVGVLRSGAYLIHVTKLGTVEVMAISWNAVSLKVHGFLPVPIC